MPAILPKYLVLRLQLRRARRAVRLEVEVRLHLSRPRRVSMLTPPLTFRAQRSQHPSSRRPLRSLSHRSRMRRRLLSRCLRYVSNRVQVGPGAPIRRSTWRCRPGLRLRDLLSEAPEQLMLVERCLHGQWRSPENLLRRLKQCRNLLLGSSLYRRPSLGFVVSPEVY